MKLSAAASILSSLVICCADGPERDDLVVAHSVVAPPARHPATCLDVDRERSVPEGTYTLYLGGDPSRPWRAYCKDGSAYLELHGDGDANVSSFAAGGDTVGETVRTHYRRIRIDPASLTVDVSDQTFATSTGALQIGDDTISAMPFGVAMACGDAQGAANVDLRGTPFVVAMRFRASGTAARGGMTMSNAGHTLALTVAGDCGQMGPAGLPGKPFALAVGGWFLHLAYVQTF